ncbi:hypothetical protein K503DRAFT_777822 [Rhizopogon vinicolor AM-OR11-026]|uniref:Uncharacterized protein n=1 Tax=Rhizopogon vinicolor AM-OR11-026 TaxID=1314800 RepID=A0A1B7MEU7_9AGAM|nr:hypothetical protein K503DRAFT_777822 [Rhizopogon vinicolor AM-OR11-026]
MSLTPRKVSLLSLKPHKNEPSLRIRNSSAALIAALLFTQLTPAPFGALVSTKIHTPTPSPSKSIKSPQSQKRRHVLIRPHSHSARSPRTLPLLCPPPLAPFNISGPTPPPFSSLNSSTGISQTPFPLSAYRGKHSASTGYAFNGSVLSRLTKDDDEDDNE